MNITDKNINGLLEKIKAMQPVQDGFFIVLPSSIRGELDRTRYRGRGRPRNSDYLRISMEDVLNTFARSNGFTYADYALKNGPAAL